MMHGVPDLPRVEGEFLHANKSTMMSIGTRKQVLKGLHAQVKQDARDLVAAGMYDSIEAIQGSLSFFLLWCAGVRSVFEAAAQFVADHPDTQAPKVYGIPMDHILEYQEGWKAAKLLGNLPHEVILRPSMYTPQYALLVTYTGSQVMPKICSKCPCCGAPVSQQSSHGCHVFNVAGQEPRGVYVMAACSGCNLAAAPISGCVLALEVARPGTLYICLSDAVSLSTLCRHTCTLL
jgi:hypothetical protein